MTIRLSSWRAAALAGALVLAAAAPVRAERLTVSQIGILASTLPWILALEKGYFKEAGLPIDGFIAAHGGGTSIRNMLASELPVAEMATPAAITAHKAGIELKILLDTSHTIGELTWAAKKGSPVKSIKDLKGKKLAFTSPRSTTESIIKTVAKRHGVFDGTQFVSTGGIGAGLTALNQGAVDAAPLVDPVLTKNGADYQVIFKVHDEMPDLSWAVLVSTPKYIEANREKLSKIIAVRVKAIQFIRANRDETSKIFAAKWNLDQPLAHAMLGKFYEMKNYWNAGEFNMKGLAAMLEGMVEVGEIDKGFDIEKVLDRRFQAEIKGK